MSQENVDVVRSSFEAFGRGDFPGVLATLSPEIEWHDPEVLPWGGTQHGHDAFVRHMQDFAGHFEEVRIDPERYLDAGQHVVVTGRFAGRGGGGTDFDVPFIHIWELRDGKGARVETLTDTATVLDALRG